MKIYSTKYALTNGIIEYEVLERDIDIPNGMVQIPLKYCGFDYLRGEGREWCWTMKAAAIRTEELAMKKIVSLKKQIARLEALAERMRSIK